MKKVQNLSEAFEASIKKSVFTGSIKFPTKYCSQIQIFQAAKEWAEEDPGLIYASVRSGDSSNNFIALDLRFDESIGSERNYKSFLYDYLKPLFKEKLGGDYIQAWDISRQSVIVK